MGDNQRVEFAVIDVETTGLNPQKDRVLDIGIVITDNTGTVTGEWSSLVNPGRPVDATFIHGISDDDVADAPLFARVLPQVISLIAGRTVVAHNASFDVAFLNAEFQRAHYPVTIPRAAAVCTMDQSRIYLPEGRHSLAACLDRAHISLPVTHRGIDDARCAAALFAHYLEADRKGRIFADSALTRNGDTVLPREWERAAEAARSIMWLEVADLPDL